jgi:hypothetical protein
MTPVPCFWTAPNGRASVRLRTHEAGDCPARPEWRAHWADVEIVVVACELRAKSDADPFFDGWPTWWYDDPGRKPMDSDPRWPSACACGFTFTAAATHYFDRWALYDGCADGIARPENELPVGAVFRAPWREHSAQKHLAHNGTLFGERLGPDGMCLELITPWNADGSGRITWCADARSKDGGFWERNAISRDLRPGNPVPLHVSPSIFHHAPTGWHGWCREGRLTSV